MLSIMIGQINEERLQDSRFQSYSSVKIAFIISYPKKRRQ